jgi:hypothetical protein
VVVHGHERWLRPSQRTGRDDRRMQMMERVLAFSAGGAENASTQTMDGATQ